MASSFHTICFLSESPVFSLGPGSTRPLGKVNKCLELGRTPRTVSWHGAQGEQPHRKVHEVRSHWLLGGERHCQIPLCTIPLPRP